MLKICRDLFDSFNKDSIKYVIVKSIERIDSDTNGESEDIDILITESDINKSNRIFSSLGFKKVLFPTFFDGLGFYIGYDFESRKHILLHIHYKLRIGNKKHKEFHLKLEKQIFENRELNKKYDVYTTSKDYEFVILLTRMILRKKHKDDDIERLNYLRKNIKDKNFLKLFEEMFDTSHMDFLSIEYSQKSLLDLHNRYNNSAKKFLCDNFKEFLRIVLRVLNGYWTFFLKIVLKLLGFPRYIVRRKGKIVAFQGVDGSGKSTQVKYLLDNGYLQLTGLKRIYGGNNEYWIPGLKKVCRFYAGKRDAISKIIRILLSVLTIIDRRLRMIPAFLNMFKGKIVIFDRYFYDDLSYIPKMKKTKDSKFKSFFKRIFMSRLGYTPHVTVFLDIDAEDAFKRKQDYELEKVRIQIDAYREIFKDRKEVKFIDATKSIDEINKEIMRLIIS